MSEALTSFGYSLENIRFEGLRACLVARVRPRSQEWL